MRAGEQIRVAIASRAVAPLFALIGRQEAGSRLQATCIDELVQFGWYGATEAVGVQMDFLHIREETQLRRKGAAQLVRLHVPATAGGGTAGDESRARAGVSVLAHM